MLGLKHAEAISSAGGIPIIVDIPKTEPKKVAIQLSKKWKVPVYGYDLDITNPLAIERLRDRLFLRLGFIEILINNAANNPKVGKQRNRNSLRLENFPLLMWNHDIAVGLTGAFLCSKIFGAEMAKQRRGVILNISSDLSLISPDQRIYRNPKSPEKKQPVKPVSYSVVKTGLIGLTRYLATYWANHGVRVNALSPGGVKKDQPSDFVKKLSALIPMGRMASDDEYQAAVLFLCSDASSYMTGANLVIDGGRTCW